MNIGASLKVARNAVTSKAGRSLLITKKHSPAILFVAGVSGVVATTVMVGKASYKLKSVVDDKQQRQDLAHDTFELARLGKEQYTEAEYNSEVRDIKIDFVKDVVGLYAPAVVVGAVSLGALTGSHTILTRRNAALTAAYAVLDRGFKEYRARVVDKFGEQTDREMMFGVVEEQDAIDTEHGVEVETVRRAKGQSIYARRFANETTPSWEPFHESNVNCLQARQNYLNDLLQMRGHVFLNEVYNALGLPHSVEGQIVGWVKDNPAGEGFISFGPYNASDKAARDFVRDREGGILLDFNVDGNVLDLIGKRK